LPRPLRRRIAVQHSRCSAARPPPWTRSSKATGDFAPRLGPPSGARYEAPAHGGLSPETMVIACSDSRVDPQTEFGSRTSKPSPGSPRRPRPGGSRCRATCSTSTPACSPPSARTSSSRSSEGKVLKLGKRRARGVFRAVKFVPQKSASELSCAALGASRR
jgi:hypothetical protein